MVSSLAITLHELSTTKVAYADYMLNNQKIDGVRYVEIMKGAESYLKECISMLMYEPQKSPEGRLFQETLLEMKSIRKTIQEMS